MRESSPRMPGNILNGDNSCASDGDRKVNHPRPPNAIKAPRMRGRNVDLMMRTPIKAIAAEKYQVVDWQRWRSKALRAPSRHQQAEERRDQRERFVHRLEDVVEHERDRDVAQRCDETSGDRRWRSRERLLP